MAKDKTVKAQYRAILSDKGIDLDKCRILAFAFDNPETFHYRLMESGIPYHIFDCGKSESGRAFAQIVIPKEGEQALIELAELNGGQRTTLVLN